MLASGPDGYKKALIVGKNIFQKKSVKSHRSEDNLSLDF